MGRATRVESGGLRRGGYFSLAGKDKEDPTDHMKARVNICWGWRRWQRSGATEHKIFPSEFKQLGNVQSKTLEH